VYLRFFIFVLIYFTFKAVFAQVFIPHTFWSCNNSDYDFKVIDTGADFSLGTFSNTNVSGNSVQLSVGHVSGTYTSPVLDIYGGCGSVQKWTRFDWKTPIPYGKELPASSEIVTDYSGISASLMNGAAEVFRMNGSGAIANGATVTASIGSNGTVSNSNGSGMSYTASGKLQSAVTFDGTDDRIDIPYTQTNASDYSISAWFKTSTAANGVFVQDRGAGTGLSLTLGIGNNPGGCAAGKISYGLDSNSIYIGKCTSSTYNDNTWHHVVGVWNGTSGVGVASAQFTIYVDGSAAATTNTSIGSATAPLTGSGNTKIARHDAWTVNYAGSLDEIGIWTRALSATEVQQIYRRGGNNVKFQIKTCDSNDCSDIASWKGPDNTNATYFTEINNNSVQNTGLGNVLTSYPVMTFANFPSLVVSTKRFFQYQATLISDVSGFQPDFSYMKIWHGCAAGSVSFSSDGTFILPKLCTQMIVTAQGGGGATGDRNGGGTRAAGGDGGNVVTTFTGVTPLSSFVITVGGAGQCAQTGGAGTDYSGGDGGAVATAGIDGAGNLAFGGAGRPGSVNGLAGGHGAFGGGGGGGAGNGGAVGAGGGGASTLSLAGVPWVIAGGGGGSGGVQNGTAGTGGNGCSGAASGDYTIGGVGTIPSGNRAGGGGGGGGCYCLGGCTTVNSSGGAGGDTVGNSCGASNNGSPGSVTIQYQ
jgi:hypothetical protein